MANVAAASAKIERTHLSLSLCCDLLHFKLSNEVDRACARVEAPQPFRALCLFYIQCFCYKSCTYHVAQFLITTYSLYCKKHGYSYVHTCALVYISLPNKKSLVKP